jgi:hypothetical protein
MVTVVLMGSLAIKYDAQWHQGGEREGSYPGTPAGS